MTDISQGPLFSYGDMGNLLSAPGVVLVPDPNTDRGPSDLFMGVGLPDTRFFFPKDKVQGYTGVVPSHLSLPFVTSADVIPATLEVNNIAAAAHAVSGVAMALVAADSVGVTINVPIVPFGGFGALNGNAVVTAPVALDYGFAFGNCTSGSTTIGVADSTMFVVGMPLVIGGVGNSGATACLLTNVASIVDATHITVTVAPLATNATTAPIGTGNIWGPSENGFPLPTAALPYLATGPGLYLDPRQALSRAVSITSGAGSSGGTFIVSGWDVYGEPMTDLITVGAATIGYGLKAFKYIGSVVPQFTDAFNYSVGTCDVFGFALRSDRWEYTNVSWNALLNTALTGWVAADATSPATNATGDVRGTIRTGSAGGGSGIGATASNGTIVSLAMSGIRLVMSQSQPPYNVLRGGAINPQFEYGTVQV